MNALLVLFAGRLLPEAFEPLFDGKSGFSLAVERAGRFPGVTQTVIFAGERLDLPVSPGVVVETRPVWTKRSLLEAIALRLEGFDCAYFAWADCPFLDPVLAGKIAERHLRYGAEYSYADGWPYGVAPEALAPGTAAFLAKIVGDDDGPVERDAIFSVLQKDINAFDIETEISAVDFRHHRLNLCADSKRNLLLLRRFTEAAGAGGKACLPDTQAVEEIIARRPEILRTLPNFFPVQVYGGCPQLCAICPYPKFSGQDAAGRKDFMDAAKFEMLVDKICAFSGDAVIDISLWGEIALHPQKLELIEAVVKNPALALVIETSGIGWETEELEFCAELAKNAALREDRVSPMPPLSWIVSLDTVDPARYRELRGPGFSEASERAAKLIFLFPNDAYVQAVRTAGAEDDIENFYRSWKGAAEVSNIIIQKYNDFCGFLPRKQASDLSPVNRAPCWHLMRDMPILIDGTVPLCSADLSAVTNAPELAAGNSGQERRVLGNVFSDSLADIWERGKRFYLRQCEGKYDGSCAVCDEYYTYNF